MNNISWLTALLCSYKMMHITSQGLQDFILIKLRVFLKILQEITNKKFNEINKK